VHGEGEGADDHAATLADPGAHARTRRLGIVATGGSAYPVRLDHHRAVRRATGIPVAAPGRHAGAALPAPGRHPPAAPSMRFMAAGRWITISWEQFGAAARRISAFLAGEGVAEQEHVAIWSNNRPEWHIADVSILTLRCRPVRCT